MRFRSVLAATTVLIGTATGCGELAEVDRLLDETATVETVVDDRVAGGWYLYESDIEGTCNGLAGIAIPCRDVLAVCVPSTGGEHMEPKWFLTYYRCTDESPTWRDVCLTRPQVEWAFYGYTDEECAAATTS